MQLRNYAVTQSGLVRKIIEGKIRVALAFLGEDINHHAPDLVPDLLGCKA